MLESPQPRLKLVRMKRPAQIKRHEIEGRRQYRREQQRGESDAAHIAYPRVLAAACERVKGQSRRENADKQRRYVVIEEGDAVHC